MLEKDLQEMKRDLDEVQQKSDEKSDSIIVGRSRELQFILKLKVRYN